MNIDKDHSVREAGTNNSILIADRPNANRTVEPIESFDLIRSVEGRIEESLQLADSAISTITANPASQVAASQVATPEVTIIIPVYNEQRTVAEVIERVLALPITSEVIVVDDGSSDGTREILQQFSGNPRVRCLLHGVNQGKGAALRTGIAQARGEFVVIQDADLEYDPTNILSVLKPLQAGLTEVAYGSRYLLQSPQDRSLIHRLGNWCLTTFSNVLTQQSLTDMETCYKAFRRELIQSIVIEENRFGFEPEITAKLARSRTQICEVPISYQPRGWKEGKKIGLKDLLRTLYCIVKYNLR